MSVRSAMAMSPSSTRAAARAAAGPGERRALLRAVAGSDGELSEKARGDLAELVIAGPGLWLGWLEDLQRDGLLEELLDDGVIDAGVAQASHGHEPGRVLTAKTTAVCVLAGCLFPDQGYDSILAKVFGLPGLHRKLGITVPSGPALSGARALLGEQVMRKIFELDAARADVVPGAGSTAFGMELTAFDGTTAEVFSNDELAGEFGAPTGGTKPKIRLVAYLSVGSRRWKAAAALFLVRAHVMADVCCRHCGRRPTSANDPLTPLLAGILAQPRNRIGRSRTSGRTAAERRTRHTDEATYTITIAPSNLPRLDESSRS